VNTQGKAVLPPPGTFPDPASYLLTTAVPTKQFALLRKTKKECTMDGELIGLVAVTLGMSVPLGAIYAYYRVRKLRSEERLAAIARGVAIPVEPELSQAARSRRTGIVLATGAIGYILTFGLIAQIQADRDFWTAAAFGIIPLAVGIGYFLDFTLIRRDLHASG
jgi:hypothetical protein